MPNSCYCVAHQEIVVSSRALELNVVAQTLSEGVWPAFSTMYYWGVYPKLPNKIVDVNVLREQHLKKSRLLFFVCVK